MGKGDKKTKRGKIILGSFGVRRPHRPKALKPSIIVKAKAEKAKVEKAKPIKVIEEIVELTSEPIAVAAKVAKKTVATEEKIAHSKKTIEESHKEPAKATAVAKAPKEPVAGEKKTTKPKSPGKDSASKVKPTEKPIG
jgi:30S ribosomal protein S31